MAPRQAALTNAQLDALQMVLAEKGIPPLLHEAANSTTSAETVENVCVQHGVSRIFYNCQYGINERQHDVVVEKLLPQVVCEGFDDSIIPPPGAVMTGNHEMYKVFTPFKNVWLERIKDGTPECISTSEMKESGALDSPLTSISLSYPQQDFDTQQFPTEEELIIMQLRYFCQQAAGEYEQLRDSPAINKTSRLSADLVTGGLSPCQCLD